MGNRAALLLDPGEGPGEGPGEVPGGPACLLAYGTNNFTAAFWYAALAPDDLHGWAARWQAVADRAPEEELDEAVYEAVTLWVPWPEARARLQAVAARAAAEAPEWGPLFIGWQRDLAALAARHEARWLGIDLLQIFAFHEDPATMLQEAREGIAAFHGPGPMTLAMPGDHFHLTGYPEHADLPGLPPVPRPAPSPPPSRNWRALWHLPGLALIAYGSWMLTQSWLVAAVTGLLLAWGLVLLVRRGG